MAYYKGYNEDAAKEAANLEDLSEEEDQVNAEILDSFFADEEENLPEEDQEEVSLPDEDTAVTAADANRAKQEGTTVITKGTTINGSIIADCSLDIMGTIIGNIECLGKLSISGKVVGDSLASEVFVNTDRLEGSITSEGSVKIAQQTVVLGDVTAASAAIAGAVKGQLDVTGPLIIDSTAVVQGDIKAKAIQINNGAVVNGHVSLDYATGIDLNNIFEAK
ncbi:MAG: polymer-forming cytoskeletal protein [Lachnospiraceae bacterium]|nr:polymer-forming cytoskeletal protein [Lachnospiraceae bacterium]